MGQPQSEFLKCFQVAFSEKFGDESVRWTGGQISSNVARLPPDRLLRRNGLLKAGEQFEIGDLRTDFCGKTLIIEFDSKQVPLSNLVKYWPYITNDLNVAPRYPVVLCHFSDWWSYGTYRDLWAWTLKRMQSDERRLVEISGRQFDHGGADATLRSQGMNEAICWIEEQVATTHKQSSPS
jgi:hypothetical protein